MVVKVKGKRDASGYQAQGWWIAGAQMLNDVVSSGAPLTLDGYPVSGDATTRALDGEKLDAEAHSRRFFAGVRAAHASRPLPLRALAGAHNGNETLPICAPSEDAA